jgi:pilus assembly protein FimV
MKSWNLKWPLGTCALLLSQFAVAIGLGEMRADSAMDERFKAELELLNIGDLNENQMVVGLASAEDFENAGVERDFQLADLQFRVDLSNQSRPVVRISSRRPIREPYLNFLVELRWPSGRLLREYTVLLDLPTFAGAAQPGTGAAQPGKSLAAARTVAADSQASSTPTSTATSRPRASGTQAQAPGRVQVGGGDTLWGLAERYQASGATIPQTMMAIAEANPDAFINGDLNLIRRGAWLEIPDAQRTRSVDRAAALARLQETTAAPPVVEFRPATDAAQATDSSEGELHLTAAGGTAGDGSAGGRAPDSDTTMGSEPGLAAVLEERDRLQRENVELQDRIQSLEAQLSTLTRLVELDDPTLAALQQQTQAAALSQDAQPAQDTQPGAETHLAETHLAETSVAEIADGTTGEQVAPAPRPSAQTDAAGAAADQEASVAAAAPAPAQAPEPAADATEPGADGSRPLAAMARLGDWLIPALGAGAALLLGLLIWAALRRGSGVQQQGLELPREVEADSRGSNLAAAPGAAEIGDDELFAAPADSEGPEDILNEADVCLSFGHDEQAEELLREALDDYPDEPRLHLKLLEVLAARDDRDAFEAHLPQLAVLGDLDAFAAAEALQRQRWERGPETDGSAPEAAQGVTEAAEIPLEDFDLDLDLDIPAAPGAPPERQSFQTGVAANSQAELEDFDLGLEAAPEAEPETAAAPRPAVARDTLEDLELFEPGQELATQLELAQAYVEMGDAEGAREILAYVVESGDESQQEAARELLARLG